MKSISILGAGSWGTAIATVAAERGLEVFLWSRNSNHLEEIENLKENKRYLPGVSIPNTIQLTDNLKTASKSDILACVIPSTGIRNFAEDISSIGLRKDSVIFSYNFVFSNNIMLLVLSCRVYSEWCPVK